MTKIVAVPLGYILNALYSFIDNYGIAIIVFTVLIRLIILPLYAAQLRSTTQMQKMQPKIKEIQTKYANDSEMMNMKLQELYKDEKINRPWAVFRCSSSCRSSGVSSDCSEIRWNT